MPIERSARWAWSMFDLCCDKQAVISGVVRDPTVTRACIREAISRNDRDRGRVDVEIVD